MLLKQSHLLTIQGVQEYLCSFPKRETFFFFFLLFVNFHICQQLTAGSIEQSFILFDNETSYKIGMEFYDQVQGNWEQLHRQQCLTAHGPEVSCSAPGGQGSLCIGVEQTGLELFRRGKKSIQ